MMITQLVNRTWLDLRMILRDPMNLLLIAGPLLAGFAVRFIFPLFTLLLRPWVDLLPYADLAACFLIMLPAMLSSFILGLTMIDERDEGIFLAAAVTPLRKEGYFLSKIVVPALICILQTPFIPILSGLPVAEPLKLGVFAILNALEVVVGAQLLALIAHNKIEAMGIGKILGVIFMAPIIVWLAPGWFKLLAVPFPSFWPAALLYYPGAAGWIFGIAGIGVHILIITGLFAVSRNSL